MVIRETYIYLNRLKIDRDYNRITVIIVEKYKKEIYISIVLYFKHIVHFITIALYNHSFRNIAF